MIDEQRSSLRGNLAAEERVAFETGFHWITALLLFVCPSLLGLGRALIQEAFGVPPADILTMVLIFAGIGFVMAIGRAAMILYARFTVTSERVIFRDILIGGGTNEIFLSQIERVDLIQDAFGFILGYGHLRILLRTGELHYLYWISRPIEFRAHILEMLEVERKAA